MGNSFYTANFDDRLDNDESTQRVGSASSAHSRRSKYLLTEQIKSSNIKLRPPVVKGNNNNKYRKVL